MPATTTLRIFATHPVQYLAPLYRQIAAHPALDVKVFYFSDHGVREGEDKEFGVRVAWDVDLLAGYASEFLSRTAPLDKHAAMRIPDMPGLLRRERPDWIYISGYTHGFERQLVWQAHRHHARLLMRSEFSDLTFGARRLPKRLAREAYLRWFYGHIDRFCYPGQGARAHLQQRGVLPGHMHFSPYSVPTGLIDDAQRTIRREDARRELGLGDDTFAFVLSGKLITRKDPLAPIEALARVAHPERAALIVLGDGELREPLVTAGRRLLGDRFIFPGFVNQSGLGRYFRAADALVMPSHYETWGLVVNEAMHHGLPAVVSDRVGCHPDLVLEGETGHVFHCGDHAAMAARLDALMQDPAHARRMGERARQHIERYTVAASARGVFDALGLDAATPVTAPAAARAAGS